MRVLTREELTAATAARQFLIERQSLKPAEAIRRLTPLQGQHPPAPHIALAARLEGFTQAALEAAIDHGQVKKATLMRMTLHLAHAEDFPAYAQLCRHHRMRTLRKRHPDLDEERIAADLTAFLQTPRTNVELRERIATHDGAPPDPNMPLLYARTLLPLTFLPPAGHWRDSTRNARFVLDPRPLPDQKQAAALVLTRYLTAFGPASRKDVADWAGVAQREFPWEDVATLAYRDEQGRELIDLPDQPLPPAKTKLPPRFLGNWDQPLLAYADRDRIIPPEIQPLKLTLSGACTVTVDGRVAASWRMDGPRLLITPHTDFDHRAIREEALRTARFCAPDGEVAFAP
ncbi:winged helix DNA-binding domain-containing protein [Solirubrobacter ginsenosidimutans]|uniref:Winged helix DNA-binding domain-containing protein n=1 Tax=Solirubrobacter ginsenosidimutans TaxID=490573 RepID=A0A9X3S3X0_9ACTN|nr:winged helix DNA-binding domain-containing protein [Solirubrobacter ginsenosidimutans]MDA0165044.1 winged helix DNA-binding domain-containing protein [Solirubrobacter ginsenosidimutans]